MNKFLKSTYFINSDHPDVKSFAAEAIKGIQDPIEQAVALFLKVRDKIRYDPYHIDLSPESMTASSVIKKRYGFCVTKAVLLAAVARSVGIPARPGFADVKNHINSPRLQSMMKTDIFKYHGYTELYLNGRWIKATPAFNKSLCDRAGLYPLDFDGKSDSLFHPYNKAGDQHMEYIKDHGRYEDLPLDEIIESYKKAYPHWQMDGKAKSLVAANADFEKEIESK